MQARKKLDLVLRILSTYIATIHISHAAEISSIQAPAVPITESAPSDEQDNLVIPMATLNGRALSMHRESTLGETLKDIPGLSSSYFGPNASRPVIRGMEGDRVQIMQNGVGVLDASSLSPDHAVGVDPLIAEQIDVIRGPATVLYGAGAVGGVVNVLDHRIPKESLNGIIGRGEARLGGADNERSAAAVMDLGNGIFALHVDAYKRETDDLSIPSSAIEKLKSIDGGVHINNGKLTNSAAASDGGAFGAALTLDKGYLGFSFARSNSFYGTVAEPDVKIDMHNDRFDFASEINGLNTAIERIKLKVAYTDYQHQEISNGVVGTTFLNHGIEGSIEGTQEPIGNLKGVIGLQVQNTRFQALGDEAFVPSSQTFKQGFYIYETLALEAMKLSAGARIDQTQVSSAGGGRFGDAIALDFTPQNLSAGMLYPLNNQWSISTNLSHTERAPTQNELFANGAHVATHQYEIGNDKLGKENANGIDAELRWKTPKDSFSISAFYTRFNNFITLFNSKDTDSASGLNIAYVRGVPASFRGFETQAKFRIYESHGDLDLNLKGDYVQAQDENTGTALPRIAPMRLGAGLNYNLGDFSSSLDILYGFKQSRVAINELPTDGYTLLNATMSYRLKTALHLELFAKARNLLDEDIRDHSSFLKEIAPMGGRSVLIGLRGEF
ncbi:MAG: TonB-dependent receptor [Candidatus Methylopumilus sp.]